MDDFAAKLTLIEHESNVVLEDLPAGVTRDRVQHVATLVRLLRLRIDVASSLILPAQSALNEEQRDFAAKLRLAQEEAQRALRELKPGMARERLQHIATLAELLRLRFPVPG
jgi:hypothetical protein